MSKRNPYFSMVGMYFQTPGADNEYRINIKAAADIIKNYVQFGGNLNEVEDAIDFLQAEFPKAGTICKKLRLYILMDDFFDQEYKFKMCREEYHNLIKRIS